MTTMQPGVGGQSGAPPPNPLLTQLEVETSAASLIARMATGIVPDSIDNTFTQLNPRYNFGYLGGFGYKTTAEQPLLDHPIDSARVLLSNKDQASTAWSSVYQSLVGRLPPDAQKVFLNNMGVVLLQRNPDFAALDNLFTTTAKVLTQASIASQSDSPESLNEARRTLNLLFPFAILKGALSTGTEVIQSSINFLTEKGANYPGFDGFNNVLGNMKDAVAVLKLVTGNLNKTPGWELSPSTKDIAAEASKQLTSIADQLQSVSLGNDLKILEPNVRSLAMIAAALALPMTGSAPLFLSLSLALQGIDQKNSSLAILGPGLSAFIAALSNGITSTNSLPTSKPCVDFFNLLLNASFEALAGLAVLAVTTGLGSYPPECDLEEEKFFAFEATLQLIAGANVLDIFFREFISVTGQDKRTVALATPLLTSAAFMIIILAGCQQAEHDPYDIVESHPRLFNQGVAAAIELFSGLDTDEAKAVMVGLKQAQSALNEKDYQKFIFAFTNILESIGVAYQSLLGDLDALGISARHLIWTINQNDPTIPTTGVVNFI